MSTTAAASAAAADMYTPVQIRNQNLYLDPAYLTANEANEKARPAEKEEDRRRRVESLAVSIAAVGQKYPVLVVEIDDVTIDNEPFVRFEYVDGGARVDAVSLVNERTPEQAIAVWCSLVDPADDLFRAAVTANIHRTQNSILDMAGIIREVRERNDWKGRGAGKKVAAYLGIQPSRVSEYEAILRAPESVRARIESGEIQSLDAALKLLSVEPEKQEKVLARAKEIAVEETRLAEPTFVSAPYIALDAETTKGGEAIDESTHVEANDGVGRESGPTLDGFVEAKDQTFTQDGETLPIAASNVTTTHAPVDPPIKARHISKAAAEVTGKSVSPKSKSDILDFFSQFCGAAYPKRVDTFCTYFTETWIKGNGKDKEARAFFDTMVQMRPAVEKNKEAAKKVAVKAVRKFAAATKKTGKKTKGAKAK